MNRVVKTDDFNESLTDPRRDANWQARLEEARARRAIALAERAKVAAPKKRRLKPWEEEGVVLIDADADEDVLPEGGLGFSERVDAVREHARDQACLNARSTDTTEQHRDGDWLDDVVPEQTARECEASEPPTAPASMPGRERHLLPAGTVNEVFDSPEFASEGDKTKPDETPLSLLLEPEPIEPSPVSAWRRSLADETADDATPRPAAPPSIEPATDRNQKMAPRVSFAALILVAALAVGPIWQMTRPVERGPLVFTLSAFAVEPALGLPSPMFEPPRRTRSGEWSPVPGVSPRALHEVSRPNVPEKVKRPAGFSSDPVFGSDRSDVRLAAREFEPIQRMRHLAGSLPAPVQEPVPGRDGIVEGLGQAIDATPGPMPRPGENQSG